MNLKNIVCSQDISLKLKELGIKQSSLFHWVELNHETGIYRTVFEAKELNNTIACAFTVEEIFDLLPERFYKEESITSDCFRDGIIQPITHTILHDYHIKLSRCKFSEETWLCWAIGHAYDNYGYMISEISFCEPGTNPANAAAKMLIYLIENNLIKIWEKTNET